MKIVLVRGFLVIFIVMTTVLNAQDISFQLIPSSFSGISFQNNIKNTTVHNFMNDIYFYAGGGVGILDINNDGLDDIYFTGNQVNNELYLNLGNFKFKNITKSAGVELENLWCNGVSIVDINGDGYQDIYVSVGCAIDNSTARRNILLINQQDLSFKDMSNAYGIDDKGVTMQSVFFDFDKDNDLDLFCLNNSFTSINSSNSYELQNHLYENKSGKYVDITKQSGCFHDVKNIQFGLGLGIVASDFNNDTWIDLYISNDFSGPDQLYINKKGKQFIDEGLKYLKHTPLTSMGCDAADFNNDGWMDIMSLDMAGENNLRNKTMMLSMNPKKFYENVEKGYNHQYMINNLQLNTRMGSFSEIAQLAGVSNTDWSWATLFADFNNDGWKDIVVSNGIPHDMNHKDYTEKININSNSIEEENQITLNHFLSIFPSTPLQNYFFENNKNYTFTNKALACGATQKGFSNGVAYSDLNNDGRIDLIFNNLNGEAFIYKNLSKSKNYVAFSLNGPKNNLRGYGAKITVYSNKANIQTQEVSPVRGFKSSVSNKIHFGLQRHEKVDSVLITWADGRINRLTGLRTKKHYHINYEDAIIEKEEAEIQKNKLFIPIHNSLTDINCEQREYNDYEKELLLPHKLSELGPIAAIGDVNNDGLDDVFLGGTSGKESMLWLQVIEDGKIDFKLDPNWDDSMQKEKEDSGAEFFDVDNDGDLDLYVSSGSNEYPKSSEYYIDRLYINNNGIFHLDITTSFPPISTSCVKSIDYDLDGDMDLFVGGSLIPSEYPSASPSALWVNNGKGKLEDKTEIFAEELLNAGMVMDAIWADLDRDSFPDLILAGEWTPVRLYKNGGKVGDPMLLEATEYLGLGKEIGWWYSLAVIDFDDDGDLDILAGNLGLNHKYKASKTAPFEIYAKDLNSDGKNDIVLGYYEKETLFPVRGYQCSSEQIPEIKDKIHTYNDFATSSLIDIYSSDELSESIHLKAYQFSSMYFENVGNWNFKIIPLPKEIQFSTVMSMLVDDYDDNGIEDALFCGNFYQSEVETPRSDASTGYLIRGNKNDQFIVDKSFQNGFYMRNEARGIYKIKTHGDKYFIMGLNNSGNIQFYKIGDSY